MTPAVVAAIKAGITYRIHEYAAMTGAVGHHWGIEAAEVMGIDPRRVFKTIVVLIDKRTLATGIVCLASEVNLKALASAAGGKRAELATQEKAQRSTGYVLGGISPLGQRRALPTFLDSSALKFDTIYVSGGKRGLEIELHGWDLARLTAGTVAAIAR